VIPAGELVTLPEPVPALETVREAPTVVNIPVPPTVVPAAVCATTWNSYVVPGARPDRAAETATLAVPEPGEGEQGTLRPDGLPIP